MNIYERDKWYKVFTIKAIREMLKTITGVKAEMGAKTYRGLYVVIKLDITKKKADILYIGISSNIYKRITYCKDHPYNTLYDQFICDENTDIVLLSFDCGGLRHKLEKRLISIFNPELNTHYKNKKI